MKKIATFALLLTGLVIGSNAQAQDTKKRTSPPASVKQVIASGAEISINYCQPSVDGRTIGVNLEPKPDIVWRTGANDATVFEVSKAVKINGKELPAGKYGLFSISGTKTWTIIFNKTWKQWGAFGYKEADDALRIPATVAKATPFAEKMTFTIDKNGQVTLLWGDNKVSFMVE
jgi:Protein of unknown function (DUF2911)